MAIAVPYGSSQVLVEVRDWGTDSKGEPQTLVYMWAPLGRDVKITPELYEWAATEGQASYFGSTRVIPNEDKVTAARDVRAHAARRLPRPDGARDRRSGCCS